MSVERSKEVVRSYLEQVVSAGNMSKADALVAADVVFISPYTPEPIRGREGLKQMIAGLHAAFPDFRLEEEEGLAEGELVASRWTAGGTHSGAAFAGLPASGRSFRITGMSIYRVRDGRIVAGWVNDDTLGMAMQLGLARVPEPA
jgi:steroid delta-isomerase-like uncharacterized protein